MTPIPCVIERPQSVHWTSDAQNCETFQWFVHAILPWSSHKRLPCETADHVQSRERCVPSTAKPSSIRAKSARTIRYFCHFLAAIQENGQFTGDKRCSLSFRFHGFHRPKKSQFSFMFTMISNNFHMKWVSNERSFKKPSFGYKKVNIRWLKRRQMAA